MDRAAIHDPLRGKRKVKQKQKQPHSLKLSTAQLIEIAVAA